MTVFQLDEFTVTTEASPRDPTEVLIEEVRQQARHRRRRNLALVAVVLVAGSAAYLVSSGGRAPTPRSPSTLFAGHGIPASLESAVNKTLGVRSVEIVTNYEPGPAIYQAPDLYAASEDFGFETDSSAMTYYIAGDAVFYAPWSHSPDEVRVRQLPGVRLGMPDGLPPARERAFEALLSTLRSGSEFVRASAGVFTFRTRTFDGGAFLFTKPTPGEITLSDGYVAGVTIRAPHTAIDVGGDVPDIVVGTLTARYERVDDNPHLVAPDINTLMCRPAGSLVLARC